MAESNQVLLRCPHCSNKTTMRVLNNYKKPTLLSQEGDKKVEEYDIFRLFECNTCKGIQLYHIYWHSQYKRDEYDIYEDLGKLLFPKNESIELNKLPANIKGAYESANLVRNVDDIMCVMGLRRALEMLCKDKGAVNGQLHQKLNTLQQKGILPPLMGDIAKVIKDTGNMSAHGDNVEFDKKLVENMFKFTNKILEYVYILPFEMEQSRKEIETLAETGQQ